MNRWALIGVGGALGALARWAAQGLESAPAFPITTLVINVLGSFAIGVLWALSGPDHHDGPWWPLLGTGLLGGFTTFSAFAAEAITIGTQPAAVYLLVSLTMGPLLAAAGWSLSERRNGGRA